MERIWNIRNNGIDNQRVLDFQKRLNGYLDFQLSKLLYSRLLRFGTLDEKVDAARDFLFPNLSMLHDPFLYNDMDIAIDRLCRAIDGGEDIMVYGDYDVDGTTSVALVYSFLREYFRDNNLDASLLQYYVPDRYTEGYGVSFNGVNVAASTGCTLIIALDCGIKDNQRIGYAKAKGIDFIVCDHHTPGDVLPDAVAVLDAKRHDNTYPFNELSGCGVGFKLMQAFCIRKNIPLEKLFNYIDLVAVSIGSDIVPIVDENRVLAYHGMLKLNSRPFKYKGRELMLGPLVCFDAIMKEASLSLKSNITIYDSVFMIGPRINAAGRMRSGIEAVKLLVSNDEAQAATFAAAISRYNEDRKAEDHGITEKALMSLKADPDNDIKCSTVVYGDGWHKGVVGIVASRLTEHFFRPTIVLSKIGDMLTGSARSVSDFDLYEAIDSCRDLLTAFGGHKFAAGLSMRYGNIDEFKARFEKYVREHVTEGQRRPVVEVEQYISFKDITFDLFSKLQMFEPFGPENSEPVFATRNVVAMPGTKPCGKTSPHEHLRFVCTDGSGVQISGIGFGMARYYNLIKDGRPFELCYTISENEFMGKKSLQIMVKDVRVGKE